MDMKNYYNEVSKKIDEISDEEFLDILRESGVKLEKKDEPSFKKFKVSIKTTNNRYYVSKSFFKIPQNEFNDKINCTEINKKYKKKELTAGNSYKYINKKRSNNRNTSNYSKVA